MSGALLLALCGLGHAQSGVLAPLDIPEGFEAPAAATGRVVEIRVVGLRRLEEAVVRAAVQTGVGDNLAGWMIQRDLQAIYATGVVDDVKVDVSPSEDGRGVVVTYEVDEKPAVREVKISGNKKIDEESLRESIDIVGFDVLNETQLQRNVTALRAKYLEKGFYLVRIEPKVQPVGRDQVDLTFEITEGRKVLVRTIDITGNEALPDRKVRRFLQTKQAGPLGWLTNSGAFKEENLEMDGQIVRQIYMEEGYLQVKVDPPKVYLTPDKRAITISIHVEEGEKFELGQIRVEGDFLPEVGLTEEAARQILAGETAKTMRGRWERAREKAGEGPVPEGWEKGRGGPLDLSEGREPLRTGDTFKLTTLQGAMTELADLYGDAGYAFANVVPIDDADPATKIVDFTFSIDKGDRYRIGRIDITGNDPTFDKVVRREIPINEAEIYQRSAINEARARMDRLGYFEEVKIDTLRSATPGVLDLAVEVSEQPTGSFSVGAGFSNLENFMFTANVAKNNFLGLGYTMRAEVNLSRLRQQWNLSFFDPYFLDSRWTLSVDTFSIARQYIEDEYQRGGSLSIGRYLDRRDDVRLSASYTFQDTGLSTIDPYKQSLLGGDLYRNGLTSTFGLSLNVDKRNNRINATRGVFASLSSELTGGFRVNDEEVLSLLGGDFNYAELKGNLRAYYPVSPKGDWLIFKYNGTIGGITSTDGSVVPYIHRYRAGGINSVRGYDWYSLGPSIRVTGYDGGFRSSFGGSDDPVSSEDRLVVGGTQIWVNNFELESPIIKAAGISTVVFFDAGNAFGDPWGEGYINPLDLRTSYGFGIRWLSPMGPLRFEWGFPINPYEDERKAVFDFSIGSLF